MNTSFEHKDSVQTQRASQHESQSAKAYPSRTIVRAKLEMTEPGDHDEQEADAVANTVVNGGKIARKISNGGGGSSGIAVSRQMESQLSQLQGGGRQMPEGLRNIMESGFGRDFSQVRLHTDSEAASMSSSIHAKAFTLGNDIYFNHGQFSPETTEGQRLVAHELTHVVQGTGKVGRDTNPFDPDVEINNGIDRINNNYSSWNNSHPVSSQIINNYPPGFMHLVHAAMINAIKMIYGAILLITTDSSILGISDTFLEESFYYGDSITSRQEQKEARARRILQDENKKTKIINKLRSIASQIQNYNFNRFIYQNQIINYNGQNTYGKNENNRVYFSSKFYSDELSNDDRAYAIIHEFAHLVLYRSNGTDQYGRPNEIYIDDLFDLVDNHDKYSDNDIIDKSPDFYVFLCASCN